MRLTDFKLMGSQTVGGTLVTAFSLRMFDYTTLFLVLIWALSPLGGQAALRMLYMESAVADRFPATVWYRNSDSYPVAVGESAFSRHSGRINAVYLTSLLAPKTARASNRDTYGNIKIPYIEEHEVTGEANAEGWHYVYSGSENYSSLIGVPIQFDIPSLTPETVVGPDNKATFTIETSYFRFDCHRPLNLSENMINKRLLNYLHYPDSKNRWRSMSLNLTEAEYGSGRMSSRSDAVAPRKLEFISRMDPVLYDIDGSLRKTQYYSYSRCSMTTSYVESNVTCLDFVCQVSAMRRSRRNHAPDHLSLLDGAGMLINHKLYDEFSVAGIQSPGVHTTMSERYLFDPETFWNMSFQSLPNIPSVDAVTFSKRLGTIFNTYWNIYQSPMGVVSIGRNLSAFEPSPDAALEGSPTLPGVLKAFDESHGVPFLAERTHTEFIHSVDAYFCAWPWLVCFVTSACILTFISLAGLVLQAKRIAPDIFWVAGLTRDSPYFRVPEKDEDSTLNGWERTKRLKNMEVMIADVEPEAKTGKIAFMAIDENVGDNVRSWSRLSLARRYR